MSDILKMISPKPIVLLFVIGFIGSYAQKFSKEKEDNGLLAHIMSGFIFAFIALVVQIIMRWCFFL